MMSVCSQLTFAATEDADAATTAAELAQTVEELNALDQWFTEAEKTRNNLQTQIRKLDRDIGKLNKAIRAGELQAQQQQQDIDATQEKITDLSGQVKEQPRELPRTYKLLTAQWRQLCQKSYAKPKPGRN